MHKSKEIRMEGMYKSREIPMEQMEPLLSGSGKSPWRALRKHEAKGTSLSLIKDFIPNCIFL